MADDQKANEKETITWKEGSRGESENISHAKLAAGWNSGKAPWKAQQPVAPPSKLDSFDAHIEKKFAEFSSKTGGDGGSAFCPDDFFNSFTTSKKKEEDEKGKEEETDDSQQQQQGLTGSSQPGAVGSSIATAASSSSGGGRQPLDDFDARLRRKMMAESNNDAAEGPPSAPMTKSPTPANDYEARLRRKLDGSSSNAGGRRGTTSPRSSDASALEANDDFDARLKRKLSKAGRSNEGHDPSSCAIGGGAGSQSSSLEATRERKFQEETPRGVVLAVDHRSKGKNVADYSKGATQRQQHGGSADASGSHNNEARGSSSSNVAYAANSATMTESRRQLDDFDARLRRKLAAESAPPFAKSSAPPPADEGIAGRRRPATTPSPTKTIVAMERRIREKCSSQADNGASESGEGLNRDEHLDSRSALDAFEAKIQKQKASSGGASGSGAHAQNIQADDEGASTSASSMPTTTTPEQRIQEVKRASRGSVTGGDRDNEEASDRDGGNSNARSTLDAFEDKIQRKKASSGDDASGGMSRASTQEVRSDLSPGDDNESLRNGNFSAGASTATASETLERRIREKVGGSQQAAPKPSFGAQSALDAFEEKIQKKASGDRRTPSRSMTSAGGTASEMNASPPGSSAQSEDDAGTSLGTRPDASAPTTSPSKTLEQRIQDKVGGSQAMPRRGKGSDAQSAMMDAFEERIERKARDKDNHASRGVASAGKVSELRPPVPIGVTHFLDEDDDDRVLQEKNLAIDGDTSGPSPPVPYAHSRDEDSQKKKDSQTVDDVGGIAELRPPVPFAPPDPSFGEEGDNREIGGKVTAAYSKKTSVVSQAASEKSAEFEFDNGEDDEEAQCRASVEPDAIVRRTDSGGGAAADDQGNPRVLHHSGETPLIPEAFLVTSFGEDDNDWGDAEVVMAEPVRFSENKWRRLLFGTVFLLILLAVSLSVSLLVPRGDGTAADGPVAEAEPVSEGRPYCSPCINRTDYKIRALVSGEKSMVEKFAPAAHQAARDMGVNLTVEHYSGRGRDERMSVDIISAATNRSADALIVTVLSEAVSSAVSYAAERGVPVFGVESGMEYVQSMKTSSKTLKGLMEDGAMTFFAGMDDVRGGEVAADHFLEQFSDANYTNALYISQTPPRVSDYNVKRRYKGYKERLDEAGNGTVEVDWLEVRSPVPEFLEENLVDCDKYQSVLIGSGRIVRAVVGTLRDNGCLDGVAVGSFEPDHVPPQTMADGSVDFVIDQSHSLEGRSAVEFAALYATTGQVLVPPPGGLHFSGPLLLSEDAYLTTESLSRLSVCGEGNATGLDSGGECIDRKKVTIAGVVHGTTDDSFWDPVFAAADQGASDMGVNLRFDRFGPQENDENLHETMATRILELCAGGVDGLFASLPSEGVADAVRRCKESNPDIVIVSVNAGYEMSKELDLIHHVGMADREAGYLAGRKMAQMANLTKSICVNHQPGLEAIDDRCEGFERAMNETKIEYLGQIAMMEGDGQNITAAAIEKTMGGSSDWDGYGMLLAGPPSLPAALELKRLHPNLVLGAFDTSASLYEALEAGDVLFGVDQQSYLQGYLPVSILTNAVTTKQRFLDRSMSTGPRFVVAPPAKEKAACEDRNFPVCSMEEGS